MGNASDSATKLHRVTGVEIFRVGDYGEKGRYTEADLDAIANGYDPAKHSASLKFDHIDQGPAAGWISRVYRAGEKLLVDAVNVSKEAADGLLGAWKNRSAEIYRDFEGSGKPYLRGLALLGAAAPHVKGLAPVSPEQIAAMKDAGEKFITLSGDKNGAFAFYDYGVGMEMDDMEPETPTVSEYEVPEVWSTYGPPKSIGANTLKTMIIVDAAGCEDNRCHKHRVDLTADGNGWTSPPVWHGPNTPGDEHQHTVTNGKIDPAPDGFGVMHTHEIELTLEDKLEGHIQIPPPEAIIMNNDSTTVTPPADAQFAEMETRLKQTFAEQFSKQAQEFAEARKGDKERIAALEAQAEAAQRNARDAEFNAVFGECVREGRMTEAQRKGTYALFDALCNAAPTVNFGEGEIDAKGAFFADLKARPVVIPVGQRMTVTDAAKKTAEGSARTYKFGDPDSQKRIHADALAEIEAKKLGADKYAEVVAGLWSQFGESE